ncbi:hypothetical protein BY996DRAFT_6899710 [Phakopsora pachyrhizi]|nr:hypothetical protein BY996DRAFT_6899710 [Phakopsora pachyrhizi]
MYFEHILTATSLDAILLPYIEKVSRRYIKYPTKAFWLMIHSFWVLIWRLIPHYHYSGIYVLQACIDTTMAILLTALLDEKLMYQQ